MLKEVLILSSVYTSCFTHALTTDREEVMGVLLGEVLHADGTVSSTTPLPTSGTTKKVARVWGCRAIQRNDKRKDRVEIAPEHLAQATDEAEQCARTVNRHTRVIGWYHSHPCITPYPSHVDLRCQQTFQQMESGWVGLIFSVFHTDSNQTGSAVLHSFQTNEHGGHEKVPVRILSDLEMFPGGFPLFEQVPRLLHTYEAEMEVLLARERCRCGESDTMSQALDMAVELETAEFRNVVGSSVVQQLSQESIPELRRKVQALREELSTLA